MKITFRGGVHPSDRKALARDIPMETLLPKGDVVIPLSQHIGKPAQPAVKKGDTVKMGQLVGAADGFVSANVHSSCSGKVKAVEMRRNAAGTFVNCVVIENDGLFTPAEAMGTPCDWHTMEPVDILGVIRWSGIVGMGGAGFPTHVKLSPKNPEAIEYIIANGAECEPYITCDDQLMRTKAEDIVTGMEILLRLFPTAKGIVLIEKNKPEAIAAMKKACAKTEKVTVHAVKTKYPQGGERSIITVVTGKHIRLGMLPADAGCIVDNVSTIYAIKQAVCNATPLYERAMTVSGEAAAQPKNLLVKIGTSYAEVLEAAGGIKESCTLKKALSGGPMMGVALADFDVPVMKTGNALTLLADDPVEKAYVQMTACLKCGRCNRVCPLGLTPQMMAAAAQQGDYAAYENKLYGLECISCGSCTYVCPAKRPLMQLFAQAKSEIMAEKRKTQGGAK